MSARFFKKAMVSSNISNVHISFYVLKTNQIRKDDFMEVFTSLPEELRKRIGFLGQSSFRDDLLWELTIRVEDIQDLELLREKLSAALSTKVAVYFDELEELVRAHDSAKPRTKPRAIRKRSR